MSDTTTSNTPGEQNQHDIDVLLTAAARQPVVTIPAGWGQGLSLIHI